MEMNPNCDIEKYQFPKINARSWEKVIMHLYRSLRKKIMEINSMIFSTKL